MDFGGHLVIQDAHDLVHRFHNGYEDTLVMEVLRHFQTDETGSDHNGPAGFSLFHSRLYRIRIGHVSHGENPGRIYSRDGGLDRFRTGRKDQFIIGILIGFTGGQIFYGNRFFIPINRKDFLLVFTLTLRIPKKLSGVCTKRRSRSDMVSPI